jgi:hypothetical protein
MDFASGSNFFTGGSRKGTEESGLEKKAYWHAEAGQLALDHIHGEATS